MKSEYEYNLIFLF